MDWDKLRQLLLCQPVILYHWTSEKLAGFPPGNVYFYTLHEINVKRQIFGGSCELTPTLAPAPSTGGPTLRVNCLHYYAKCAISLWLRELTIDVSMEHKYQLGSASFNIHSMAFNQAGLWLFFLFDLRIIMDDEQ